MKRVRRFSLLSARTAAAVVGEAAVAEMRNRGVAMPIFLLRSEVLILAFLVFVSFSLARGKVQTNGGGQGEGPDPAKLPPINPTEKFDPHVFSGLWRPAGSRMMTD